jgi:hypothetical protein
MGLVDGSVGQCKNELMQRFRFQLVVWLQLQNVKAVVLRS